MSGNKNKEVRAVLIAGPTASGKSALALELACELGGTVINADSMQVYRDLRIVTARPRPEEETRVPHRLYGHVDAGTSYSTGRWCAEAAAALAQAQGAGRLPILVGGTGLYFKALTHGLAAIPPIPADVRARIRARVAAEGIAPLYAELEARDPETAARLMPGDRTRVARALEVVVATGRSIADWQRAEMRGDVGAGLKPAPTEPVRIFLSVERSELYARIDARFERMLAAGAIEEVARLRERRLDPALPAMKAHGVPWLMRHLDGEIDLATAAEGAKRDTRRYSKRQVTWFRHQLPPWTFAAPEHAPTAIRAALGR
ncbi:MAG TPA: tRNA (adenosine(37)-N6)-dimethylallyltransferase MiaA [Xanthobacteraceae bacterium]|jgi:tRNA dimethylallyltransferase